MAFGYSFKESPVKQNQSPEAARRSAATVSIVFYLYSRESVTCLALPTPYRLDIANFAHDPLILAPSFEVTPLQIYGKALRFPKLECSRQPTVKI